MIGHSKNRIFPSPRPRLLGLFVVVLALGLFPLRRPIQVRDHTPRSRPAISAPASTAPTLTIRNFKSGEIVRYPVVLLCGEGGEGARIRVVNADDRRPDGSNTAAPIDGKFKILVELAPGTNHLRLEAGSASTALVLTYKPMTTPYRVNVVYVTPEDGDTHYPTQKPNDPQNYRDKLDTAVKLMQTFTAERMNAQGFGRKTFNLEFNRSGKVVVHTVRFPASAAIFRKNTADHAYELYDMLYDNIVRRFPESRNKNLVITAVGGDGLGDEGMGLWGAGGLFAWPDNLRDVERAFTDTTPVDTSKITDDTDWRGTLWSVAAVTIGGCLHELGHCFGLEEHSADPASIMSSGCYDFNRAFTLIEPPSSDSPQPYHFREDEAPHWEKYLAAHLNFSRWFQPDATVFHSDRPPRVSLDRAAGEVVIQAPYGVGTIRFYAPTYKPDDEDPPLQTDYQLFPGKKPTLLRYSRRQLRARLYASHGVGIIVTDTQGNFVEVNEGTLSYSR